MVLTEESVKEQFGIEKFSQFMVLDTKEFKFINNKKTFGYNIEILNLIRHLNSINKVCTGLKAETSFDTSILHLAIDKMFNEECFTDIELLEYFKVTKQLYSFADIIAPMADLDQFKLPLDIDLLLLGIPIDTYANLGEKENDVLHGNYCDMLLDFLDNSIECEDFIKKAKIIVNSNI